MKNGKTAELSGLLSEILKTAVEAGVGMITDLVNQIIVEGVIPAEKKLSTIVKYSKGKGDALEKENYGGLKLTS